jgi:beta-glucanase (GH16 family)
MRWRTRTATAGVGLLLAAAVASCTSESSSSSPHQSGLQLEMLPPVAQTGAAPGPADDATPVLVATSRPARAGRLLTLQHRSGSGWTRVATAATDGYGMAEFAAPSSTARAADYRVVAAKSKQRSTGEDAQWVQKFSDEFDGSTLDDKWAYRALGVTSKTSGRRVSASSKAAVQVGDGVLRLQVKADPRRRGHYLNGHISTESTYLFRYGVAAARIRFERPRGTHGAFWSQSPDASAYPGNPAKAGTEIDVAEYFGSGFPAGGLASYVYHYDASGTNIKDGDVLPRAVHVVGSADAFWRTFHVYSVEWSPDGYVFRIDGKVTYVTDRAVSKRTQYLVLSLLSSDWELPHLDKRQLPATMQVDWVRVWQR